MILLGLVVALLVAGGAQAQPVYCLDPTQSWAWTYYNDPIAYITYYLDKQVLAVGYQSTVIHEAANVPLATAQRFQSLGYGVSPGPLWNSIRGSYPEILQAQDHCPLLAQDSHFLLAAPSRQDVPP